MSEATQGERQLSEFLCILHGFQSCPAGRGRPTREPQKCYNCAEPLRAANGAGTTGAHGAVTSLNASRTCKHDCVCGEGRQALRLLLHTPRDILKRQRWNGM